MRKLFAMMLLELMVSCAISQSKELPYKEDVDTKGKSVFENGTLKVSNPELEYEVLIFDPNFEAWFRSFAKPRGFYSLNFLELKNRIWAINFNSRSRMGTKGYDYTIDYHSDINYGYEVNYMLYNYLLYFQQSNRISLE